MHLYKVMNRLHFNGGFSYILMNHDKLFNFNPKLKKRKCFRLLLIEKNYSGVIKIYLNLIFGILISSAKLPNVVIYIN